jgi:hypothetical protein
MQASPEETFTPGRLAHEIGSQNRDSVRNTLLVLASKDKIEKVGVGKYRARRTEPQAANVSREEPAMEGVAA